MQEHFRIKAVAQVACAAVNAFYVSIGQDTEGDWRDSLSSENKWINAVKICEHLTDRSPQSFFNAWTKIVGRDPFPVAILGRRVEGFRYLKLSDVEIAAIRLLMATVDNFKESDVSGVDCHGLDTPTRICFYENDYYIFSNFSSFQIKAYDHIFPTSEHLYQWRRFALAPNPPQEESDVQIVPSDIATMILQAPSAHEAYQIAQKFKYLQATNWKDIKFEEMKTILKLKVEQHEYVREKLIKSGTRTLVENSWRDGVWGIGQNGDGENMLGTLWMEVRQEYDLNILNHL